jgi:hypothetical protein
MYILIYIIYIYMDAEIVHPVMWDYGMGQDERLDEVHLMRALMSKAVKGPLPHEQVYAYRVYRVHASLDEQGRQRPPATRAGICM